ncbi:MAG TPA: hypothetical protein VFG53_00640 [Anaeromyxobacter sp.]|nr:hypothetical protein [Anaeromyxobacter sp.]
MPLDKSSDGPRWPRGQKFVLSQGGRDAHEAHRAAVASARGLSRSALEAALAAWAEPRKVEPGDGVLLGELKDRPRGLQELTRALENAGSSAAEVRAAVGRLVAAGLADPVPTPRAGDDPGPPGQPARS